MNKYKTFRKCNSSIHIKIITLLSLRVSFSKNNLNFDRNQLLWVQTKNLYPLLGQTREAKMCITTLINQNKILHLYCSIKIYRMHVRWWNNYQCFLMSSPLLHQSLLFLKTKELSCFKNRLIINLVQRQHV